MEQPPTQFSALQLICMMAIILRAVAKQLGVIVSPIELVAQSGSNVIAATANYHSVILLGPDGTEDAAAPPPPPAIWAPSMPSSGEQSRAVAKPPPFPPPHRGGQSGKGSHGKGGTDSEHESESSEESGNESISEAPWKRQRRQ